MAKQRPILLVLSAEHLWSSWQSDWKFEAALYSFNKMIQSNFRWNFHEAPKKVFSIS